MLLSGIIITDEKDLKPGMELELVNKDNRQDRKPAVVNQNGRIEAGGATFNLSGADKIGCRLVVA